LVISWTVCASGSSSRLVHGDPPHREGSRRRVAVLTDLDAFLEELHPGHASPVEMLRFFDRAMRSPSESGSTKTTLSQALDG
jgi:hypothetical protein